VRLATQPCADDALGLQAGDGCEATGNKPPLNRLLDVSANFRFLLAGVNGSHTEPFLFSRRSAGGPQPEMVLCADYISS
jgi:hypothetical protein